MSVANRRRKLLIVVNDRTLRRELESMFSDLEVTASRAGEDTLAIVRRTEPTSCCSIWVVHMSRAPPGRASSCCARSSTSPPT
ncbi:MAG TPA: hypothetical protein VM713_01540 [Steroidobacteraceae bacterium]|nr:hypothetical protein [Steroidobacteraceae bacterium]